MSCPASTFSKAIGRCQGLKRVSGPKSADECRGACCEQGPKCMTWQWCAEGAKCSMANECWTGEEAQLERCAKDTEGWTTGARDPNAKPPPPAPPPPLPPYAKSTFDDSSWETVETPHDWSIMDLPARADDMDTPAVSIRNGTWKFSKGDDSSWSAESFDDSKWTSVTVPSNWRDPPLSYTDSNATGWFRRHFSLTAAQLAGYAKSASPVMLALGEVACNDATYVVSTAQCCVHRM